MNSLKVSLKMWDIAADYKYIHAVKEEERKKKQETD